MVHGHGRGVVPPDEPEGVVHPAVHLDDHRELGVLGGIRTKEQLEVSAPIDRRGHRRRPVVRDQLDRGASGRPVLHLGVRRLALALGDERAHVQRALEPGGELEGVVHLVVHLDGHGEGLAGRGQGREEQLEVAAPGVLGDHRGRPVLRDQLDLGGLRRRVLHLGVRRR